MQSLGIGGLNVADTEVTFLKVHFQIRAVSFWSKWQCSCQSTHLPTEHPKQRTDSKQSDSCTLIRVGTHSRSVSPLGPRVVPLCRPGVVVDKVHSAIVLTLLCENRPERNKRKKVWWPFLFKPFLFKISEGLKKPSEIRSNSITTWGRSEGFTLFGGENVSPLW